jgi:hypothetical protein
MDITFEYTKPILNNVRKNSSEWIFSSFVLASGQIGINVSDGSIKIGNGTDIWNNLPSISANISNQVEYINGGWDISDIPESLNLSILKHTDTTNSVVLKIISVDSNSMILDSNQ